MTGDGNVVNKLDRADAAASALMRRSGHRALQISLAVIFIWFGLLKVLDLSPAAELVKATVAFLGVLTPDGWYRLIGYWEVLIGVTFLFHCTLRVAIGLLALQMVGTFLPLLLLPEVTFQPGRFPYAPTLEGQYIVKNLLIIAAALVLGGTVRNKHDLR